MPTKGTAQITLVDLTDAYGVTLTSEAHTFPGSVSAALAGSVSTQVIAMRGAEVVAASVTLSEVVAPAGVTITKDADTTSPTLTIAVSTSVTSGGVVKIPVHIGAVVINKEFSFAIAFQGTAGANGTSVTITSTAVTYQAGSSGTTTPTGEWSESIPSTSAGQYLWTRTAVNYSDGKSTTSYAVSYKPAAGANGTSVTVSSTSVTYQVSSSGTTTPTGEWLTTIPSVPAGQYLWTKTVVTYSDAKFTTSYAISRNGTNGTNGSDGADALVLVVTSSNGATFKNTAIATVLTCHIYKAGVEVTGAALTALGTIKWYKDGGATAVATGAALTIDAGQVTGKAVYAAQLE